VLAASAGQLETALLCTYGIAAESFQMRETARFGSPELGRAYLGTLYYAA